MKTIEQEARAEYNGYVKHILTLDAKRCAKRSERWGTDIATKAPFVILGDSENYVLSFQGSRCRYVREVGAYV